jgi:hypothetical protein
MVVGIPAKVTKELPPENEQVLREIAAAYFEFARPHMPNS